MHYAEVFEKVVLYKEYLHISAEAVRSLACARLCMKGDLPIVMVDTRMRKRAGLKKMPVQEGVLTFPDIGVPSF